MAYHANAGGKLNKPVATMTKEARVPWETSSKVSDNPNHSREWKPIKK